MSKKLTKFILITVFTVILSYFFGFMLSCLISHSYQFYIDFNLLFVSQTLELFVLFLIISTVIILLSFYKNFWSYNTKKILQGKEDDLHLTSNLEQSRFQTEPEIKKNFKTVPFKKLAESEVVGTIIKAEEKKNKFDIVFSNPAHALVIGTTGSGKTTTFVNPTIQILCQTKTRPSFLIADPKGELYAEHAKNLLSKGYEVKVIDLRNPYNSIRWNPLERAFLSYQKMLNLEKEVTKKEDGSFEFEGKRYITKESLDTVIQVRKQQLNDDVYEDLHDVMTMLCPINNNNEPLWESGSKNLVLAIALALLEDSENPKLNMTKEKFNFFSISKVATSTDNDCEELINFFKERKPLSKAVALSKQVLDSSEKTRGSYLSTTFDKLSMFSDQSLCALTSENEIEFGSMGEKAIALFLQIPDEKETRHTLASMVILQAYKELVQRANTYSNLSLPRPVYFVLDEFGNLPKIHKLEQMITVGRSRNIWLNLIIQSYAQLSKTYDDKVADIIKSNCNVQIFIGTTDYKTIEEFSKRCGNFSIVQRSLGFSSAKSEDLSSNLSVKERPLIYPSELQLLNNGQNMGNAIVTIFGYHPIRSKFTPSFKCRHYLTIKMLQKQMDARFFDENKAFYDMKKRNKLLVKPKPKTKEKVDQQLNERRKSKLILEQIKELIGKTISDILPTDEVYAIFKAIDTLNFERALYGLNIAKNIAVQNKRKAQVKLIDDINQRIKDFISENQRH